MKTSSGQVPGSELIWNDMGDPDVPDCKDNKKNVTIQRPLVDFRRWGQTYVGTGIGDGRVALGSCQRSAIFASGHLAVEHDRANGRRRKDVDPVLAQAAFRLDLRGAPIVQLQQQQPEPINRPLNNQKALVDVPSSDTNDSAVR